MDDKRRERYPCLDTFEDVMANYVTADYLERTALRVMAVMDWRSTMWPEGHFYAMTSAITAIPASGAGDRSP